MKLLLLLLLLAAVVSARKAEAQGCSACRDATAGSAPKARAGLRKGILTLGVPAGGVCVGIMLLARGIEKQRRS